MGEEDTDVTLEHSLKRLTPALNGKSLADATALAFNYMNLNMTEIERCL